VAAVDPDAVAVMLEVGIDISGQQPKRVDPFMRERVSYLVTLCEREIERTCPIFPGAFWRLKWPIETRQSPMIARNTAYLYAGPATKSASVSSSSFRNIHKGNRLWNSKK
jgi:protein-tyrosine-phosphatase